ncbi:MAG: hypothetical protein WAT39_15650 [Planctomycetota bacterium]
MQKLVLASFLFLPFVACGGGSDGGGGGPVSALRAPDQVAIVNSNSVAAQARLSPRLRGVAGSDYETDRTQFWVRDDSMQALDTVNMILRALAETRYWEQTNNGPYRALVEMDENGGGERGNTGPQYEEWIVDSTRTNNSSPQVVAFWIGQDESMGEDIPSMIYGRLTVTAEATDAQPLGQFTLYFKNLPQQAPAASTDTLFEGYLRTVARNDGQSEVEFFMSHGDVDSPPQPNQFAQRERVHVIGNPTTDSGRAYSESAFAGNQGGQQFSERGEYQLQFNANYVARRDVRNGNALAVLDRNDFQTRVHRYGVYDSTTENRADQLSGFPVQDGSGHHGWAGFHGIWFPENVTLTNGQTLYRRSWGSNTTTPYTLFIAPGKLMKRTRSAITLADVVGEDLEYFSPVAGGEQRVRYTGSDLVRTATRVNGEWQEVNPPVSIANTFTQGQWCNFWSRDRGQVEFAWPASLLGTTPAFVWTHTTITADSPELASGDLTLNGYFNMLRANITSNQANFQNGESPYLPNATAVNTGNQTYVFDRETMLLTLGGNPVTLANGVTVTQGPAMWGLNCGPLFTTALQSLNEVQSQTVTFDWSIGTNPWNQLRVLRNADNAFVQFDPPLRLTYVHDENGSSFDNRTFFLEWDGSNLQGIPHEQVEGQRWYPLFNIPTGTVIAAGNASYKVKQLEGEQFMVEVNNPAAIYSAQGFDLDGTPISAPTADPYTDPAIGAKPTVEGAPLYVGGVSQTSSDG